LEGKLESGAVCRAAKTIFGEKVRLRRSQTARHPRPARRRAEHEMRTDYQTKHLAVDALKRLQAKTAAGRKLKL
jgi:hypothetical protein